MSSRFCAYVGAVSRATGVLAAGMIALAVLVVCEMVFARYVLGESTIWQTPFATYLLMGATFLGSPYVLYLRGHVNVDLVPIFLGGRARLVLALVALAISLFFTATTLWLGSVLWWEAFDETWMSSSVWRVALWIPYLSLPAGMLLMTLQLLAELLDLVAGRTQPFGKGEGKGA